MSGFEMALFALIGLAAVFTVVYIFGQRINNYSVVDVACFCLHVISKSSDSSIVRVVETMRS